MSIAKVSEIIASSPKSFEDAVARGIERASRTLENIRGAWIAKQQVGAEKGKVVACRLTMGVAFVLKDCVRPDTRRGRPGPHREAFRLADSVGARIHAQLTTAKLGAAGRRLAEGEGFEPPVRFPVQRFSRPPPSTARPSLRGFDYRLRRKKPEGRVCPPCGWYLNPSRR